MSAAPQLNCFCLDSRQAPKGAHSHNPGQLPMWAKAEMRLTMCRLTDAITFITASRGERGKQDYVFNRATGAITS